MSRRINTSIKINATPEVIWCKFMDFEGHKTWNPFFKDIRVDPQNPSKLIVNSQMGQFSPTILENITNKRLRWIGYILEQAWLFSGEHTFEIIAESEKECKFIQTEEFSGLLAGPILLFFGPKIEGYFHALNQALKRECEAKS